ncbi:tetratricopeptide repeat (TPR)-like superfamily protein [Wolffia australiana]
MFQSGELALQGFILVLAIAGGLALFLLPRAGLAAIRRRARASAAAHRHFILGAQHLARARAAPPGSSRCATLVRAALAEADRAAAADPRDAAAHVLRAAALELLDRPRPAIRALDAALSEPAARSLDPAERAEALAKRAELRLAAAGRRRGRALEAAREDLAGAVRADPGSGKALVLLGECLEEMGRKEEARRAFEAAVGVDSDEGFGDKARAALRRLEAEA